MIHTRAIPSMSRIASRMKNKDTVIGIVVIMLWSFSIWVSLLPIMSYYHEVGHGLAALAFGVRILRITPEQIVTEEVLNPTVFSIIGLSGGFFEGLLAMLLFLIVDLLTRRFAMNFVKRYRLILVIIASVELAFMTHAVSGFVKGTGFYSANYNNTVFWWSVFVLLGITASVLLQRRWKVAWDLSAWRIRKPQADQQSGNISKR